MLIPSQSLFAIDNLNNPAAYAAILSETNLVDCTPTPSPCLFYKKVSLFLNRTQFPFLKAVLERVETAQEDLSLRNIFLLEKDTSPIDDEIVYRALVKPKGYASRLFTSESWAEWTEDKTSLGRVIFNYLEFAFQEEAEQKKLVKRSHPLLEKANQEAQELLEDLQRPLIEKIELLRSDHCYHKLDDAELQECDAFEATIGNAIPREFEAEAIDFKMKKNCCKMKLIQNSGKERKVTKLGENETKTPCATLETHLKARIPIYRHSFAIKQGTNPCN